MLQLKDVPKKQRRMVERLMRDSCTRASLSGSDKSAWDSLLAKAGHEVLTKKADIKRIHGA